MLEQVLSLYGIPKAQTEAYGHGLINHTWKVTAGGKEFILQKINDKVFRRPEDIDRNITAIADWLKKNHPGYFFLEPVATLKNQHLVHLPGSGYYRLFPFVKNSITHLTVTSPQLAYEAARQFGLFTRLLNNFPVNQLAITLPGFHDLGLRYQQLEAACKSGNEDRIRTSTDLIRFLREQAGIAERYVRIQADPGFRIRVSHHDTKISNVLFDEEGKGLCVIDLDTVMPGYFISDAGDMLRTYLSPVSEEETDLLKVQVRKDYFEAILDGYLQEMGHILTKQELEHFVYAGKFMIYMQAVRFLTDHLENDRYYGAVFEGQNYQRAQNQASLLMRLIDAEASLLQLVEKKMAQVHYI